MTVQQTVPVDLVAEASCLTTALAGTEFLTDLLDIVPPADFWDRDNRRLLEAMAELEAQGRRATYESVGEWLRDKQELLRFLPLLEKLSHGAVELPVARAALRVRDKARTRKVLDLGNTIAGEARGDTGPVQDWLDTVEQRVFDVAHVATASEDTCAGLGDVIISEFTRIQAAGARGSTITGLATGFTDLDEMTSGLHPGEVTIIAARPGMGKTGFVGNLAVNVASAETAEGEPRKGVIFFSLEMPKEQIASRMAASEGRVSMAKLRTGRLNEADWRELTQAAAWLRPLPIVIDDRADLTLMRFRARIRRVAAKWKRQGIEVGLVIVDYLQLMKGRGRSREEEVADVARGLKITAKELRISIVACAQLNRGTESRAGSKRPELYDLRESGSIEQDADVVAFIYRDEYYNKDSELRGVAEILVRKQRNGPTGTVALRFYDTSVRFDNLAPEDKAAIYDRRDEAEAKPPKQKTKLDRDGKRVSA